MTTTGSGRPTPLESEIVAMIREHGPLPIDRYMALCLGHPRHGYYMTRDPFGGAGDFTTAPEISQMFGELIGLWAADTWARLGSPSPLGLVELGPGRGTLMADALRAARVVPAFRSALAVHLVETSPVLRELQRSALGRAEVPIAWHEELASVPAGPLVVIANEFFDALPVRQFERIGERWHERVVGLDAAGRLAIGAGTAMPRTGAPSPIFPDAPAGAVTEWAPAREALVGQLARRLAADPGAALIIDYGHVASAPGDTLQAVSRHRPAGILDRPGACDLTAHVDFAALARAARAAGAACHGPMEMGPFLRALGIEARSERLSERADPPAASAVATARDRLTDPAGMGSLFKVLALTSPGVPAPAPFATETSAR